MFAPKVARPKTKAAESSTSRLVPHRATLVGHRLGHDPVERALFLQRAIGNQATVRLLERRDSALSKEAEVSTFKSRPQVAPALRAPSPMRLQRACFCDAKAAAGGMCENCLHKQSLPPSGMVGPASVQRALAEPGESLEPRTRARMERRFGFDFGAIRIHPGEHAAPSARDVGARAYTVGRDIVFGAAEYRPGSAPISGPGPSPARCECGRSSSLTESPTRPELIDKSVAQRQPDVSDPTTAADEASLPAGAPPNIEADLDPVPDDEAAQAPQSTTNGSAQLSRSVLSSLIIQRQAAPAPAAAAASPVVAKTLSWSDFPLVPSRINGMSARTGFVLGRRGKAYNLSFNPATSWSVQADQTALLLRHEQYHLNLAALIINKANAAVGTMGTAALDAAVRTALATHTRSYDGDSDHSRNAPLQTAWEMDIDAGVPEFPITPAIPGR